MSNNREQTYVNVIEDQSNMADVEHGLKWEMEPSGRIRS